MTNIRSRLPFWKMHGTGNDFIVMAAERADAPWGDLAREMCDRHFGVGSDGLILVLPSEVADRRMRMFNPDGSEAEMCGNGLRCFVKFCLDQRLVEAPDGRMTVETLQGVLPTVATFEEGGRVSRVRLSLGKPNLEPRAVGVSIEQAPPVTALPLTVKDDRGEATLEVALVSMGNPHAVQVIDGAPADWPLTRLGPLVEHHPLFEHRTNFEVVRVLDRGHVEMRVWERGVGETLACGSGAGAVAVACRLRGLTDERIEVRVPGGRLDLEWDGDGPVWLAGPVVRVFEATYETGWGD